ncbi:IS1595 family transposase [Marivirga sp.]|uniref:IS1595 family transposase n=1 Tax=Marivirga sp. TaxID=2018662 RepID=UPI002D803B5C|nr:IS1595 family transposase [Marivirga sp.]HET8861613.1 IS1595 family transposase [Marivirga sp.]
MAKAKLNILKELQNLEEKELKIISKNIAELLAKASAKHNQIVEEINEGKERGCPSCGSVSIIRFGFLQNRNRFRCKDCKKTFTDLTGTAMSYIKKKHLWEQYIYLMVEGNSLRDITKKMDISLKTAFDWRHKILTAFDELNKSKFEGIVEVDDVWFLKSEKGKRGLEKPRKRGGTNRRGDNDDQGKVLFSVDRSKNMDLTTACMGRLKRKDLDRILGSRINGESNILCSDKHPSIKSFAKTHGLTHYRIDATKKQYSIKKIYHVNNLNNLAKRFKEYIKPFNGVATKYLQNYLNLFRFVELFKNKESMINEFYHASITDKLTLNRYSNLEQRYQNLIT